MKCLLIDIGYDFEEYDEPLGIEVLYSYLKYKVPYIETHVYCANYDGQDYGVALSNIMPDLIGISTHINTWNRLSTFYKEYLNYCKNNNTKSIIVLGGELATYEFEILLKEYPDSICIIGEGESALLSIAMAFQQKSTIESIKNSLIKDNTPNVAFFTEGRIYISHRDVIKDLSALNFPIEHAYIEKTLDMNGLVRIEASRGCPWNKCSFCVLKWKYAGEKWRHFSVEKVLNEIVSISSKNPDTIYFTDEEFIGSDTIYVKSLLTEIIAYKKEGKIQNSIEFVASTSVNALCGKYSSDKNSVEHILSLMKLAGFRSVFLGIESGSDSQLRRFCKGITVNEIEHTIAKLREYEIETDIGYILFDPLMTIEELEESLDFLERNGLNNDLSRFAKRIRIVPHTRYCDLKEIDVKGFDYNAVEYLYTFQNSRVSRIFLKYNEWENSWLSYTHKLQAEIRFLASSDKRLVLIEQLKEFRIMEYKALRYLLDQEKKGIEISNIDVNEIDKHLHVKGKVVL